MTEKPEQILLRIMEYDHQKEAQRVLTVTAGGVAE